MREPKLALSTMTDLFAVLNDRFGGASFDLFVPISENPDTLTSIDNSFLIEVFDSLPVNQELRSPILPILLTDTESRVTDSIIEAPENYLVWANDVSGVLSSTFFSYRLMKMEEAVEGAYRLTFLLELWSSRAGVL